MKPTTRQLIEAFRRINGDGFNGLPWMRQLFAGCLRVQRSVGTRRAVIADLLRDQGLTQGAAA